MEATTKIIATLGPATNKKLIIQKLAIQGMDIARLNMSHGTKESHQQIIDEIKQLNENNVTNIKIMIDTKGPEMRIATFKTGKAILKNGQQFILTTQEVEGDEKRVTIKYKKLIDEIKIHDRIFANNGMFELIVKEITKTDIICKVKFGGLLTNNKGVNVPGITPKSKFLSSEDKQDLLFAIKNNVDYISASFVSSKQNVLELKEFLNKNGGENIKIFSKIENWSGVKNIKDIIKVSDGIMVARGDLGVEIPLEKVPMIQKRIIKLCGKKPAIVATEMLESMTNCIRPTRAEVSDVANAILDGAWATMLSGETAVGKYPALVVKTMNKIILETEKHTK